MNRDVEPFLLLEAVLTLYPQNSDGEALTDLAVWTGSCANGLKLSESLDELLLAGSGDLYETAYHVGEKHVIEIDRTWMIARPNAADYKPQRNQQYVLDIVWRSPKDGFWHRRLYFGVTARNYDLSSSGVRQFGASQVLRAQRYITSGGAEDEEGALIDPAVPSGEAFNVGFFREPIWFADEYLLGHYRWQSAVQVTGARVIAMASSTTDTVIELEVNGVLTGEQLTLPAGTQNTEVDVSRTFTVSVPAGQAVRWKIISGPDDEESMAWQGAVTMQAKVV